MKNEQDTLIVHALPGRVRLKIHRLKHNASGATAIQRDLLKVSGISHVEANPQTGSLLIEYDPHVLEALSLHPSVSACLGRPRSDLKPHSVKDLPPAKAPTKKLKSARKVGSKKVTSKRGEKAKPKKKSSQKTKGS
jgi:cation transport ATPase